MPVPAFVQGDLRVQFLSPTLVRFERAGPQGFEDRRTFTVVNRTWPGVAFRRVGSRLVTPGYTVDLAAGAVRLVVGGRVVYEFGALPKRNWLPAPAATGPVWAMADAPRLVPPPGGAIPENLQGTYARTSGYDTGNDAPDVYLFVTKDAQTLRRDFLRLTGPVPLVPRYTLGYWDSRWFPYSEKSALASIDEYRRRGYPLDLFVCDTDWRVGASKGYGVDTKLFPNMGRFLRAAHAKGVRVMFNDHPEPQTATALDPQETVYRWNGLTDLLRRGLDVWWYDRNWSTRLREPMPGIAPEVWGASVFHDVTEAVRPQRRPLIMANVDGIDNGVRRHPPHPAFHRYPVSWTGDTSSTWDALRQGVDNGVDEGVLGLLPYVHEDLGGHTGDPTPELYARFLQYGAVSPVMRVHCTYMKNRYPWAYGATAERAAREAIAFRYALIPTLYSATFRTATDGMPLLRRLDLEWPAEKPAASARQFLLGDDLLVSPVTASGEPPLASVEGPFHAEYFANPDLAGEPKVVREEPKIDFEWAEGSPSYQIPRDGFSARWTGRIVPSRTGEVRFGTTTDDGLRLYLDGKRIIDGWGPSNSGLREAKVRLEAGKTYDVRMEYQEIAGRASAHLRWDGDAAPRVGPPAWSFWCPPGVWIDPWTGGRIVGPRTVTMPVDLRRLPMLVRDGAVLFLGDAKVRASDEQLARPLTVEAYPGPRTVRTLVKDDGISAEPTPSVRTAVAVRTATGARLYLGPARGPAGKRELRVRIHLRPGETVLGVTRDGVAVPYAVEKPAGPAAGLGEIFAARGGPVAAVSLGALPDSDGATLDVRTR